MNGISLFKKEMPTFRTSIDEFFNNWMNGFPKLTTYETDVKNALYNAKETDKTFEYSIEIPGLKKENIELIIEEDFLKVTGTYAKEKKEEKDNYFRYERSSSAVGRYIGLPENASRLEKDISATYKDGILNVVVPKVEPVKEEKKVKKIDIK